MYLKDIARKSIKAEPLFGFKRRVMGDIKSI